MSVLQGVRSNNRALAAKIAIKELNDYRFACTMRTKRVVKALACLTFEKNIVPRFVDLDAELGEVGRCMQEFHDELDSHMDDYSITDVFVYGGHNADISTFTNIMKAGGNTMIPGAAEFVVRMVEDWFLAANQYEMARRASAQKQLENMGVSQEDIDIIINDPMRLRRFIAEQRAQLKIVLITIKNKLDFPDPLNPVSSKEEQLYQKHADWFENDDIDEGEYLPNDAAVNYPMLLVEIMAMVVKAGADSVRLVYDATEYMIRVMHAHMSQQSTRVGWERLSAIGEVMFQEINLGPVIVDYVTDSSRCLADDDKLASPLGRGPLRICRIAQCLFDEPGPFSLLNAPHDRIMSLLIECRRKEENIKTLVQNTKFVKEGAIDLFISSTVAWLIAMERFTLLDVVTGRNDLSVPKLLSDITNHNTEAFADLTHRSWALMHDIQGRGSGLDDIDVTHFPEEHMVIAAETERAEENPQVLIANPSVVPIGPALSSQLGGGGNDQWSVSRTEPASATQLTVPAVASAEPSNVWSAPRPTMSTFNPGQSRKNKNKNKGSRA